VVEKLANHLMRTGVKTAFIGGSTGESHSLTVDERLPSRSGGAKSCAEGRCGSWFMSGPTAGDSRALASQAQSLGATAIAALAAELLQAQDDRCPGRMCSRCCRRGSGIAFLLLRHSSMTRRASFPMPDFLDLAIDRIRI